MERTNHQYQATGLMRRVVALALVLCLCIGLVPAANSAESVGDSPAKLTRSAKKFFVQVPANGAVFFTGATYGTGTQVTVAAGTVCQLVTDNWYTVGTGDAATKYYGVFYNNVQYQVRVGDVKKLTDAELASYIENSIWKGGSYPTLKKTLGLVGDVRVYALQLALQKLGYYSATLDGDYGQKTDDAVYKFQRANKLSRDGDAGPITQQALYALVAGASSGSGSGSGSTGTGSGGNGIVTGNTGTLKTRASVNLRERATKDSPRLDIVPINTTLTYFDTSVSDNVTWYKVVYGENTGWLMGTYVNASGASSGGGGSSTTPSLGSLTTIDSVNLRKAASKSSVRLGVVPKGITLSYTDKTTVSGVTWYKVTYGGETGWIMGTYTNLNSGGSNNGTTGTNTVTGKLTITKPGTVVRLTPGGKRSGTLLAKGSIVDMLDSPVTSGSYTWYKVKLKSGLIGYVRSDCAQTSTAGSTTGGGPATSKKFICLPAVTELYAAIGSAEGKVSVPAGTVLMMVDTNTITKNGVEYCRLYYQSKPYYAQYAKVSSGIMDDTALAAHVLGLWNQPLNDKFYDDDTLIGDVRVYAMQVALYVLGYYTDELDGSYGNASEAAVRNFQRTQKGIEIDGIMGNQTWPLLTAKAKLVSNGSTTYTPGGDTGTGGGSAVEPEFGTVYKVKKAKWNYDDNGAELFPKSTTAQVMDVETGKVFTIYRWSGGNHADCVPLSTNDTRIMCEIAGAKYQDKKPTAAQLKLIKGDLKNDNRNYTWPDFNGNMGGTNIGSTWDRRAAWLNVNGTVYCVSIYGYPHGWMDTDKNGNPKESSFTKRKFEEKNNFYGMICVHFVGSKTHGGAAINSEHQAAIDKAYSEAKKRWGTLVE